MFPKGRSTHRRKDCKMKNILYSMVVMICCLTICLFITANAESEDAKTLPSVSEETEICIECHINYSPGIVEDWLRSRHAAVTPEDALKKPEVERRISVKTLPDDVVGSVVVGCYECHGLNADAHADNFEHAGISINVIVSPNDCKTCHIVEADQYADSKKAHAVDNLRVNPVYHALVETTIGLKEFKDDKMVRVPPSDSTKQETCYACHGTDIKVKGMRAVSTDVGDMELPILSNWPSQGVGRINPDGSRGACTSCHPRHSFSIEIARKPHTCSQCHLEPDVPAWNVYKESKHGNIYASKYHQWQWNEVPWKLGKDFNAPTCSVCHNSLITTSEGKTVTPRTHNFGDRLWVRIFGLIYSHPQPVKGNTYIVKNADGLPMPTTFTGDLAEEHLISAEEQAKRQMEMKDLCQSCHGSTWVNAHFAKLDKTIEESDRMVLTSTQLMSKAWKDGLADNSNPFDESIEHKWLKQWLFYANSIRYASAMSGAPDYAAFKNGWWSMTTNLQEMQSLIALKGGNDEKPPEAVKGSDANAQEGSESNDDTGFGGIDLSVLSILDKEHLGLGNDVRPILKNIDAELIILEFMSVYCPSCQMQAPIFNQLHSEIGKDSTLQSRVKMLGIGVGNNPKEVSLFREDREVAFPILPDPKFVVYERLANSMRTPYTLMLRKDAKGNLIFVGSHMGLIRSYESYLAEIKAVMEYSEDSLKQKQGEKLAADAAEKTELKLSGEELMAKVREAMIRASGDESISIETKAVPEKEAPEVYEGKSEQEKYFAVVVNRESVCDICHAIQFIYVFNEKGEVVEFEPIHLTKYGNKVWSEKDIEKIRKRVVGKNVLQPISFDFDPEVDAVTSATITSAVIFKALAEGREIFRFVTK